MTQTLSTPTTDRVATIEQTQSPTSTPPTSAQSLNSSPIASGPTDTGQPSTAAELSAAANHAPTAVPNTAVNQLIDSTKSGAPISDTELRAFREGYLRGLNERATAELHRPDFGEEPYPEGQHGAPVAPDPFFIPDRRSVWD